MKLCIIVPCYNEEEILNWTVERLQLLTARLKEETETEAHILLVDDGSRDRTWSIIQQCCTQYDNVSGLKFSHNEGHQNALWGGIEQCVDKFDASVSIDADLQDDETAIVDMAKQANQGADIVYGVRKRRETDTLFKRATAQGFYRIMQTADPEIIYNHADFRWMSQRAMRALLSYPERNLFLRGVVRQLGFHEGFVYYDRKARTAGESKYPLKKMIQFSIDGITSFSVAPLRWITYMGLLMTLVAFFMIVFALVEHCQGKTIEGWTSMLVSLWFIGGVVTTGVGITGVYIGKIYTEVKRRPRYFIEERINI